MASNSDSELLRGADFSCLQLSTGLQTNTTSPVYVMLRTEPWTSYILGNALSAELHFQSKSFLSIKFPQYTKIVK